MSADLAKSLDKAYEDKALKDIWTHRRPPWRVTDKDAELLAEAFNIKTVRQLGENKFFAG